VRIVHGCSWKPWRIVSSMPSAPHLTAKCRTCGCEQDHTAFKVGIVEVLAFLCCHNLLGRTVKVSKHVCMHEHASSLPISDDAGNVEAMIQAVTARKGFDMSNDIQSVRDSRYTKARPAAGVLNPLCTDFGSVPALPIVLPPEQPVSAMDGVINAVEAHVELSSEQHPLSTDGVLHKNALPDPTPGTESGSQTHDATCATDG
jgi:hypothetical protein